MNQVDIMPTVTKLFKVGDLPGDLVRDFPNPKQLVTVTVTDANPALGDTASIGHQYQPTKKQQASLDRGVEQIKRGEFVSDEVITDFRRKHGCL